MIRFPSNGKVDIEEDWLMKSSCMAWNEMKLFSYPRPKKEMHGLKSIDILNEK
jgi:hypothetical protein